MSALFTSWTGLELLDPELLWLLLVLPVALVLRRSAGASAVRFAPAALLAPGAGGALPVTLRQRLLGLPALVVGVGLALGIVAVARPVAREAIPPSRQGIDILLCIDTSSSMAAKDLDPERTRLEVARDAAIRFVEGRPDDRIGLVTFARYPDLRCPLTLDHRALAELLAGVELVPSDGPEDATGMGTAVGRAAQILGGSASPSRVVILLTDGDENVATTRTPDEIAPIHAAQLCRTLDVRVDAIAVGLGEPGEDGALTELDTRQVRSLAERTEGAFFTARDADAVSRVYAEIDTLTTTELPEPRYRLVDRYLPFLLLALGALALGRLLGATCLAVRP